MKRMLKNSVFCDKNYAVLLEDLDKAKVDLDSAYANLANVLDQDLIDYATDPDLIDCYIYELQSVQMRYKFLLGRVKQIEDSYAKNPLEASGT